uniref:Splicing factor YJU2 n=1 Tax=Globisporangium ultimum (strain ATCC 200006 / CBS 805.95 / DAOM BR144) TaxID=431595 RepID=K3WJI6_GLOUD
MGERKVLNKYFPPDFDPSLVPRRKRPKNEQIEVRMMLPFSIQCNTCGEYMYRGKKFNSRKEEVTEETYHGIRIFRFYIKCITCSQEITFKTDPKRGDYVAEHGCVRNFEPWREHEDEEEAAHQQREDEEKGDSMKALENRTLDSKREMDILDALDEIKAINQRHAKIDTDVLLQQHAQQQPGTLSKEDQQRQLEEDMLQAKLVFQQKKKQKVDGSIQSNVATSLAAPNGDSAAAKAGNLDDPTTTATAFGSKPVAAEKQETSTPTLSVIVKKKSDGAGDKKKKAMASKKPKAKPVLTSLVAQYSDSD